MNTPTPSLLETAVLDFLIAELTQLGTWVRKMEYNRDDAPDEIARAIENRVRFLESLKVEVPPEPEIVDGLGH